MALHSTLFEWLRGSAGGCFGVACCRLRGRLAFLHSWLQRRGVAGFLAGRFVRSPDYAAATWG